MNKIVFDLIAKAKRVEAKHLDLGNCGIIGILPAEVCELEHLETLILSSEWWDVEDNEMKQSANSSEPNAITALPSNFGNLHNLKTLILRGPEFNHMDLSNVDVLQKLPQLEYLDLGWTSIRSLEFLHRNMVLRRLVLSASKVSDISRLENLSKLEYLNIFSSKVKDLSPLRTLVHLEELYFSNTNVNDLSPLESLINLTHLNISRTKILSIAPLSRLNKLTSLKLSNTLIDDLEPLRQVKMLETLWINSTQIKNIEPIGLHEYIHDLKMNDTHVTSLLPIRKMLERKDEPLFVNDLFRANNRLVIDNCPLTNPPYEIAIQGNEAILRYWQRQDEEISNRIEKATNWHCKLVVVGNGGVGKSTLLGYLKHGGGAPETKQTEWMEIAEWVPEHEFPSKTTEQQELPAEFGQARVQVFDFGGQEYYHDTHHLFFSTNTAYLVLWNAEKNRLGKDGERDGESSATSSIHYPLEYWLDAIRHLNGISAVHPEEEIGFIQVEEEDEMTGEEYALTMRHAVRSIYEPYLEAVNGVPALVVQTYIDQSGIHFLDQASLTQSFPWIMDFESVSLNPQKPMRLEILKAKLLELIGKIPILGAAYSTTYAWVRDAVQGYPEQATMSVSEFQRWVNETLDRHPQAHGRKMDKLHFDAPEIMDLIGYLGSLGNLLHFREDASDDRVFLRPDLVKAMILELLRKMSHKRGFFTEQEAAMALEGLSSPHQLQEVLALLQAFKMAFQIGPLKDGLWAAPLYLPEEAPAGIELLLQVFERPLRRISFRYFIHKSVVLEFFQQHVQEIKSQPHEDDGKSYLVWRNGMVLQTPDSKELVLVRFFIGESEPEYDNRRGEPRPAHIDVFSFGVPPQGKAPAESVIERLRAITKAWRVDEEVTVDGRHFVPIAKLEAASAKRETHFSHGGQTHALEEFAAFVEIPWDRIFVSYAEEDEAFCKAFEKHIWPLQQRDKLIIWSKGQLKAGMQTDEVQQRELENANIIVLLVSADYFYNRDIWNVELKTALARSERGECKLAVVVVQACDWKATELAKIHHLNHGREVGDPGAAQAWVDVVEALRGILKTGKERRV